MQSNQPNKEEANKAYTQEVFMSHNGIEHVDLRLNNDQSQEGEDRSEISLSGRPSHCDEFDERS